MGYAGYYSTTAKIKDKRSPLEQALAGVESLETLELLEKVTKNSAVAPAEEKYRRLKLSNAKIQSTIVEVEGGLAAMAALGWQEEQENGEAVLALPKGGATMAQVRDIIAAQQEWKKSDRERQVKRSKSAASLAASDTGSERDALRAQLEADRRERAAAEPVTKGSVAQALPSAGDGPRLFGAKDAGINCGDCDC